METRMAMAREVLSQPVAKATPKAVVTKVGAVAEMVVAREAPHWWESW